MSSQTHMAPASRPRARRLERPDYAGRLDPMIERLLTKLPNLYPASMSPDQFRKILSDLAASRPQEQYAQPVERKTASFRHGDVEIGLRIYKQQKRDAGEQCSGAVVFFHGGGWVGGDLDTHEGIAEKLAAETSAAVVSVDYRRPPEHPFPAAVDDCLAALDHVSRNLPAICGNACPVAVAGDSAGANLAAVVAQEARNKGILLSAQLLIYPATDLHGFYADPAVNLRYPSRAQNADGFYLTLASLEWFVRHYVDDSGKPATPRASPIRCLDLAELPPAIVCVAEFDPLRDEGIGYAEGLLQAGVDVTLFPGEGLIHGYFSMNEDVCVSAAAEARRARSKLASLLKDREQAETRLSKSERRKKDE